MNDMTSITDTQESTQSRPEGEKLQKLLARMGLGSRRGLEDIIKAGRVSINGQIATLGDRATTTDEIRVDGRLVRIKAEREKRRRVIAYYKPEGEISSASDPEGRPTVFDRLPKLTGDRWVMVGRLDINSSGLLLFTNDGELAHRLMHPSSEITREYAVRVLGEVTPTIAQNLTRGVELEDGMAKFDDIKEGGGAGVNKWYHVKIKEGRKREVRRMFESQELKVSRLIRTRYGTVLLPKELRTGRFIELDAKEIGKLIETVGLRPRIGTGLNTATKEKQARIHKKPLKSREIRRQKHERHEREEERRNRMNGKSTHKGRSQSKERTEKSNSPNLKNAKFYQV
ncbi:MULTISPECIES: 23S rRNA pseudouridine(2605) synthase RluB [unclassified Moraxella]|uniref:23S rRNA pseudouridine(2605) synthase RluB n=1 Tax=unclassified Moraxella TaxID=2685852 RepID=UPI00359E6584